MCCGVAAKNSCVDKHSSMNRQLINHTAVEYWLVLGLTGHNYEHDEPFNVVFREVKRLDVPEYYHCRNLDCVDV